MTTILDAGPSEAPHLPSWTRYIAAGIALPVLGAASVWTACHLAPDQTLHDVALFAHLACLVVGFGAVLTVDWVALRWLARQCDLSDVLRQAGNVHVPIWGGFAGLVLSGVLLEPDVTSPMTQAKLGLVLLIGWNGLLAMWLHARLTDDPRRHRLGLSAVTASLSQLGWWGAMAIGFVNAR
ncbi:hypothetical protein [Intrasporangium sp. DVR]|uniref:hypothetical protein n=1 Tax=Intrasporangium sp. DVR TaxID=3127867 RepID=UPI00313A577D